MPKRTVPALVAGPYRTPRCRIGGKFPCVINGTRTVVGITKAPIPWPYARAVKGNRQLFVSGGLERDPQGVPTGRRVPLGSLALVGRYLPPQAGRAPDDRGHDRPLA